MLSSTTHWTIRQKKVRQFLSKLKIEEKHFKGGSNLMDHCNKAGRVRHIAFFVDKSGKILIRSVCSIMMTSVLLGVLITLISL